MLAVVRQNAIREQLVEHKTATVAELAQILGVTKETIRRDLRAMEAKGELLRTHGGAHLPELPPDTALAPRRRDTNVEAKEEIARKCDSLIHPGDSIFLDGSMTAWYIAQRISHRSLTVLTPSLPIASLLAASPSITLVLVGGSFSRSTSSCTGVGACQALEQYFVDKAFLSPRFVSLDQGLTDPTEPEARLRKTAMAHARSVYLAVDSSKLDRTSFAFIAPLSAVTGMISEGVLPEPWRARLEKLGKEIL